ncbi:MAG: RNA methyltransferase [Bacteroidetes bacterium]|nr:RNA methyltransferase [Bacteroidota bacterium]
MTIELKEAVFEHLSKFVSPDRLLKINTNAAKRITHMQIVLEDIYQGHNASAVLRSADCFGIQHIHIVENNNKLNVNDDIAMGSDKWLSLHRYNSTINNTKTAIEELKQNGFKIVATVPNNNATSISDFNINSKFALVFGTEITGISDNIKQLADEFVTIPMYGFTESFNISVSAALCMHALSEQIRNSNLNYGFTPEELLDQKINWLKNSIKAGNQIYEQFIKALA